MNLRIAPLAALVYALVTPQSPGAITGIVETNIAPDTVAITGTDFGEDVLSYNDRTHQHNGVAFDANTGLLSTTGTEIVGLPSYLLGGDYVLFDNDGRDNAGYSAVVTADTPSTFYVLVDNRINGLNFAAAKTITTDPVTGGSLQWLIDGNWERVNTGISPNGQADYTAIDEAGDGTGPGVALNNFMSVYKYPAVATSVTVSNGRFPGNNIAVVAIPTAPPPDPIVSYSGTPLSLTYGSSAQLSWLISTTATSAAIAPGVGSILPQTDALGAGTAAVSPLVNTTYTLTVTTPGGNASRSIPVEVRPAVSFTSNRQRVDAGDNVVLTWRVRPDATVSLEGIGNVDAQTDDTGVGSITVQPQATRDYVLTAEVENMTDVLTVGVIVRPPGPYLALIDIGATGGRTEPGSANNRTIGGAAAGTSADLVETPLLTDTGSTITLALDATGPDGQDNGTLDWRDRGDSPDLPLNRLGEDFVKNNNGMIRATLGGIPAGTWNIISYHVDLEFSQSEAIRILVTDATGTAVERAAVGDASWEGHPGNGGAPLLAGITTGRVAAHEARFQITSNGTDPVVVYFDATASPLDREMPLNGLWITGTGPRPVDASWALVDVGAETGQAEPGSAGGTVIGLANGTNGTNLGPINLTSRTNAAFTVTIDNLDPAGNPVGALDWRDRGDAPDVALARLAEDFVKNNAGLIRLTLGGLPAGSWEILTYHTDPTLSQSSAIRVFVTDADRTAVDTGIIADASFPEGDAGAPQLIGLSTGFVDSRTASAVVSSDGTSDVILYYDGTQSGPDLEVPLNGIRITAATPVAPATVIAVTAVERSVAGQTASVSVTFASESGATYSAYASPDPSAWGAPVTTTLNATGSSTVFTESNIPLTATRRFYQIRKN